MHGIKVERRRFVCRGHAVGIGPHSAYESMVDTVSRGAGKRGAALHHPVLHLAHMHDGRAAEPGFCPDDFRLAADLDDLGALWSLVQDRNLVAGTLFLGLRGRAVVAGLHDDAAVASVADKWRDR